MKNPHSLTRMGILIACLVDPRRLELLTSSMPWKRSSQLNYGPVKLAEYTRSEFEIKPISELRLRFREDSPALFDVFLDAFQHDFVDRSALVGNLQASGFVQHEAFGGFDRLDSRGALASGDERVFSKQASFAENRESVALDRDFHRPVHDDVGFVVAGVVLGEHRFALRKPAYAASRKDSRYRRFVHSFEEPVLPHAFVETLSDLRRTRLRSGFCGLVSQAGKRRKVDGHIAK